MSIRQKVIQRQGDKTLAYFQQIQYCFARHLRDPQHNPAPRGIEERRMAIYRDLIYRNIAGFIANGFPVLRSITDDLAWHQMVRDFLVEHTAHTPYFPKLAQEFVHYLANERENDNDFPFMLELAHYEWIESVIMLDNAVIPEIGFTPDGNLLAGIPVLSPLTILLAYQWPVHKISADYLPKEPAPSYLLVYRNRNDEHGFIELNPVAAKLLEYLQQNEDQTGYTLLTKVADELRHPDPEAVLKGGATTMQTLLEKDILLGIRS